LSIKDKADMERLFAEMGIHLSKPDIEELGKMATIMELHLEPEEIAENSIEIRRMYEVRESCRACSGLEGCTVEPAGFDYVFSRSSSGQPHFSIRKCHRRVQYEEMVVSERLLASCRIPEYLRHKSFKLFDGTDNAVAKNVASKVIQDHHRKGVIFYGSTGVGKTHLAAAILNNRIITGGTGIYATMPELMDDLRSAMRNNTIEQARQAIVETDLLFLDDIGAENPSEFVVEELFKIVNGRMLRQKQIIGTTNLSPESFMERYAGVGGARIVSRLHESCDWVEMFGRDRRI